MARPNKIEQLEVQHVVARCLSEGTTSVRKIAAACTTFIKNKGIKDEVSPAAVHRYLEQSKYSKAAPTHTDKKKESVTRVSGRIERIVNYDLDIIELQYRTTNALLERFEFVTQLPEMMDSRLSELEERLKGEADPEYLSRWKIAFVEDLRRNIQNVATLNRELRENSKFMADMRSKAFEFELIQEYLYLFMDVFRKANAEAYEVATAQIAANPRMQRIVEQQQQLRGGDTE